MLSLKHSKVDPCLHWHTLALLNGLCDRDDMVDLVGSYQFDDQATEGGDVFARDPYILRFRCRNTGRRRIQLNPNLESRYSLVNHNVYCVNTAVLKDLVMIPVHTKPDDSDIELDELYDVFMNVKKKWKTDVRTRKKSLMIAVWQHLHRDKWTNTLVIYSTNHWNWNVAQFIASG